MINYIWLQIPQASTNHSLKDKFDSIFHLNYWMVLTLIELGIILFLLRKIYFKNNLVDDLNNIDTLEKSKSKQINMGDLLNNINKSKTLYKQLASKCHPDKFPNDENKNKIAEELLKQITDNKHDYKKLLDLKNQITNQLEIII